MIYTEKNQFSKSWTSVHEIRKICCYHIYAFIWPTNTNFNLSLSPSMDHPIISHTRSWTVWKDTLLRDTDIDTASARPGGIFCHTWFQRKLEPRGHHDVACLQALCPYLTLSVSRERNACYVTKLCVCAKGHFPAIGRFLRTVVTIRKSIHIIFASPKAPQREGTCDDLKSGNINEGMKGEESPQGWNCPRKKLPRAAKRRKKKLIKFACSLN